ncbi:MAG TPA: hypothetical protein VNW25_03425 [Candidatus Sulfotelmatobacter sp.]|jgi:hypothetical protein|nr:hypothetical protein [Candidatus Sulfotelmatobacter sp.]
MASMLQSQHPFDPGHNFVAGRPRGLVHIDESKTKMLIERSLRWRTAESRVRFLFKLDQ